MCKKKVKKRTSKYTAFIKKLGYTEQVLRFFPVWMFLLIFLIFTPIIKTLAELTHSTVYAFHNLTQLQSRIFRPYSGIEVLPLPVQEMLSLLHHHNVTKYHLSTQLQQNQLLLQRITESAWPIKRDSEAVFHLLLISEVDHGYTGIEIGRKKEIALVYIPTH